MMKYKGYYGVVTYDEDAKILHGEVIGLQAVITFQAENAKDIEKEFHESIDVYLEWCKERGVKPKKEFSGNIRIRLDRKRMQNLQKKLHSMALA